MDRSYRLGAEFILRVKNYKDGRTENDFGLYVRCILVGIGTRYSNGNFFTVHAIRHIGIGGPSTSRRGRFTPLQKITVAFKQKGALAPGPAGLSWRR